jgi:hypothetical protein
MGQGGKLNSWCLDHMLMLLSSACSAHQRLNMMHRRSNANQLDSEEVRCMVQTDESYSNQTCP